MYSDFTDKYNVMKTLKFGLKPQGETLKNIEKNGILEEDFIRSREYKKVQKLADDYHKKFIDNALQGLHLSPEHIQAFADIYEDPSAGADKREDITAKLRGQVSEALRKDPGYNDLFNAAMYNEILPEIHKDDPEAMESLAWFEGFTTYFGPYNKHRELIYSPEDKRGTIGKRVIDENLPIYIDNIKRITRAMGSIPALEETVEKELKGILGDKGLKEFFELENYSTFLTQVEIDRYNSLIGGYTKENGESVRGINKYISEYNQSSEGKENRQPLLVKLRKQILSEKTSFSFTADPFNSDEEVLDAIYDFDKRFTPAEDVITATLINLDSFDTKGIYIQTADLRVISNKLFDSWKYIENLISDKYDLDHAGAKKTSKYEKEKRSFLNGISAYSVAELDELPGVDGKVSEYIKGSAGFHKISIKQCRKKLYKEAKIKKKRSLRRDKYAKDAIKDYLDAVVELRRSVSMLMVSTSEKDAVFYSEIEPAYETLSEVTMLYDKTRNYITSKPYSTETVKLNFGSSIFLDGWSESVEKVKLGTILMREGRYYLGIIAKGQGDLFAKIPGAKTGDVYQKMKYNLISGANKSLPHVVFSKKGMEKFNPSDEILRIYKNGTFKKGKTFSLKDCHALIDFYKDCIENIPSWSCYNFNFSETASYEDISGFYREVEEGGYSIEFRDIDREVIDKLVKNGQLYLFEIWHKDFSAFSHGKADLSTIYWRAVFDPRNKDKLVYKLNGGAELFYRKASIDEKDIIRHKAGDTVKSKNPLSLQQERVLDYDIIKDKRFTMDHFQLNVPITLNASAPDFAPINTQAKLAIKESAAPHVIGVSRGENSLIYITVVGPEGNIVEKQSLNVIDNTDYAQLLAAREAARDAERKNWETIEGIKQLKDGYLSQVVRILADLMIKYDAVIAIEDLNTGFKRSRQKIEKAVYQQLEAKLIKKLNFLVNKDAADDEIGSAFNAYQLTSEFQGFEKMGKQTGFIFYVSPWKTTAIDSKTGFINLFDTRYKNIATSRNFWHTFDNIDFDEGEGAYRFDFDYIHFVLPDRLEMLKDTKTDWSVFVKGERLYANKTDKGTKYEKIQLEEKLSELFEEYGIGRGESVRKDICAVQDRAFHEELMKLFGLAVSMRFGSTVVSPVRDDNGHFFAAPTDENGAYNIARKGLLLIDRIRNASDEEIAAKGKDGVSLAIRSNDWLKYVQK